MYADFHARTCEKCPSEEETGCLTCADEETCSYCAEGYYLTEFDVCKKCSENCNYCEEDGCLECKKGMFIQDGECVLKCKKGYFGDTFFQECTACWHDGCVDCDSGDRCTECSDGYTLTNQGWCEECPDNCEECLNGLCVKCAVGWFSDYTGMCVTSADCGFANYGEATTRTCDACPVGCSACASTTECTDCLTGYSMAANDLCKGCDGSCEECADEICTRCKLGFYLDASNQCVDDCGEKHFHDFDAFTCGDCSTGCVSCMSAEDCFECERGYQSDSANPT